VFHTTNTVPDMLTPLQNVYMNGAGAPDGFAGWPKDAEVERVEASWLGGPERASLKREFEEEIRLLNQAFETVAPLHHS